MEMIEHHVCKFILQGPVHSSFSDKNVVHELTNDQCDVFLPCSAGPNIVAQNKENKNHRMLECNSHMMHHSLCALQSSNAFTRPEFQSRWHHLQNSKGCLHGPHIRDIFGVCVIVSFTLKPYSFCLRSALYICSFTEAHGPCFNAPSPGAIWPGMWTEKGPCLSENEGSDQPIQQKLAEIDRNG